MAQTLYEQVGGEAKVREVIGIFVDRVMGDIMIGFFFRKARPERLKELEFQHAAAFLGGPVLYQGRPLEQAHGAHRILPGQFDRRHQILQEVLDERGVSPAIRDAWLAHQQSLRRLIVCTPNSSIDT